MPTSTPSRRSSFAPQARRARSRYNGVTEFDLGPGLRLEERITASEGEGIHARWEYGRWLLAQRKGKQLPNGLLDQLVAVTRTNATELKYRMVFAERYTTEDEVVTAVTTCKSWTEIRDGLSRRYAGDQRSAEPNRSPSPFMFGPESHYGPAYYQDGKVIIRRRSGGPKLRPITWELLAGVEKLVASASQRGTHEIAADIRKSPAAKKTFLKVVDQAQHELDALKRLLNGN